MFCTMIIVSRQYTIEPSPLRKHFGYLAENTLDVHRVVFSVQNLLVLVKPLIEASQILSRIIRWDTAKCKVNVNVLPVSECEVAWHCLIPLEGHTAVWLWKRWLWHDSRQFMLLATVASTISRHILRPLLPPWLRQKLLPASISHI